MDIRTAVFVLLAAAVEDSIGSRQQMPNLVQTRLASSGQQVVGMPEGLIANQSHEEATTAQNDTASKTADISVAEIATSIDKSSASTGGYWRWLKHLFAGLSTAIFVKISCLVGNMLVQVSPFSQVRDWEARGTTDDVDPAPYMCIGMSGWQWSTYGFAAWVITNNDRCLVLVYANFLGALMGSYYTLVFYRLCENPIMWEKLRRYLKVLGCMAVTQVIIWITMQHQRALVMHSFAAAFCSFLTAFSLLACLPAIMRSNDATGICVPLVAANFFGALMWVYWGVLMWDFAIIGTNTFAAFASSACLYVKFNCAGKTTCADSSDRQMGYSWTSKYQRKNKATELLAVPKQLTEEPQPAVQAQQ